ncbi:hypothetical protein KB20921_00190 [Edwardsiella ictaluri]|nr:hypothetical protein KH20906_00190 [Edwardsiella ictaluri]BEI00758.1 hypothetical protein KB20921_00190 [Edwardsiella ictaluri]BEI04233.1 hypothetical protein KH201010_00190 [Edwardsiella ictaluri]BEI07688.1 hypothetical protein STU22726_00190 [Edwardsiella ictaluri]BEI11166.1 hypothetical protein STU22816_00190 [Edwardsiella ictaluri]
MIAAASVKDDRFLGFPHPNNQKGDIDVQFYTAAAVYSPVLAVSISYINYYIK